MGIWISDAPPPQTRDPSGNPWITYKQAQRISMLLKRYEAGDEEARAELTALHLAWGYEASWIDASLKEIVASWQAPP